MLYVYLRSLFQNLKNSYFFHIYIFFLGNSLPQDICCMAADGKLVFAAYGNVFSAFARNKEVCITELLEFVCLLQLVVVTITKVVEGSLLLPFFTWDTLDVDFFFFFNVYSVFWRKIKLISSNSQNQLKLVL